MVPFESLTEFYETISDDSRIGVTHISLYMALLYQWNLNQGKNPISINRNKIMKTAKISARRTYNRCINQLHEYGYIKYIPSSNPFSGSVIYLRKL
jgi:hypothetical protein